MLIALMGLIGYVNDEMQRRSKEIAIRKVNGATAISVLRMVLGNVLLTAVPSAIAGAILAGIVAGKWLEDFSVRTNMSPWLFCGRHIGSGGGYSRDRGRQCLPHGKQQSCKIPEERIST